MGKDIFDIRQEEAIADFAHSDARRQRLEYQQWEVCGDPLARTPTPRIVEALRRADARQAAYRRRVAASAKKVREEGEAARRQVG